MTDERNEIFIDSIGLCLEFMLGARHLDLPSKLNVDRLVQLELDRATWHLLMPRPPCPHAKPFSFWIWFSFVFWFCIFVRANRGFDRSWKLEISRYRGPGNNVFCVCVNINFFRMICVK